MFLSHVRAFEIVLHGNLKCWTCSQRSLKQRHVHSHWTFANVMRAALETLRTTIIIMRGKICNLIQLQTAHLLGDVCLLAVAHFHLRTGSCIQRSTIWHLTEVYLACKRKHSQTPPSLMYRLPSVMHYKRPMWPASCVYIFPLRSSKASTQKEQSFLKDLVEGDLLFDFFLPQLNYAKWFQHNTLNS